MVKFQNINLLALNAANCISKLIECSPDNNCRNAEHTRSINTNTTG